MTIEREQQELDDVKEYLENIDKMFPYALPEEREELKKTVQRDIDVREHRLKRKYNIAEAVALQNEAMYDEAEAKKLENTSRAEYALSAMHSAGLKVGTGFAKGVSDIGMGLTGWTARALGGDDSTAGAIGRDLMQKNRDFKNMLDEAVIQGTGFDSSKLEGIPGSVVRAGEGLAEMELPMAVVSGVSGLTKLSPLAKTGLEGAMLGLQNIPAHSDYIEQTSGKFKPLASAFTGMASGELMSYAFYFGRTHGMTERAAMNFAKEVASSGVGRTLSEGAKQGLKTAITNSLMNGVLGTGMKEYAALPDNATDEERSRAWSNIGEGLLHEFIMGLGFGFHGGVKETMQAKQRYRAMVKSGKEMMSLVKTPEEQKNFIQRSWENTKNTFKDFFSGTARDDTAFDRGVAKYFLDIERQTKLADKTRFDEVFEGSEKNLDDFIKSIQDNVPEEFRKNPAVFGEALDAFKDSLVLERNFIAINKFAEGKNVPYADAKAEVFEVNKQGKVITKDEFLRKTYADEMKARLEELKQRKADLEKQKAEIDKKIKDKNTTLKEKQDLAEQKERTQAEEDEISRQFQTPYTRAEVIESVRDLVARKYKNNPQLLEVAMNRLSDFISNQNSSQPIGVDDAIGLLIQIDGELSRLNSDVKFDSYNSDIEDIISPKLIGSDVIYGNDERNMPTSALPNNTQPQSVLPSSQETPLLEYKPTGRRQMPISEGSNQPINNMDVGNKVNRESPSSFGVVNDVPRSVNMLEKPTDSIGGRPKTSSVVGKKIELPTNRLKKSEKAEALQTKGVAIEKGELKGRDMPMSVSQPGKEPMAVKKESAPKSNMSEKPTGSKKPTTEKSSPVENIVRGKKTKMTTKANGGMKVDGEFAVVDVNKLKTATDIGETQNRNRKTVASQAQINSIANNPNPEYLIVNNPDSANGAMVISSDGAVLSGNGRTLGLSEAYKYGNADKYKAYLKEHAPEFGIDPREIDKIENPVLVRIVDSKDGFDVKRFVKESNESRQLGRNSAEIARTDAENIKGILREFNNIDDIASPSNKEFIQKFFEKTVGDTERANYLAEDGSLTPDGRRRVENALIASLYGDNSRLIEKLTNTTNEGIKNIANALMATAKDGAKLKGEVDKGMYFDVDLTKEIGNAALTYADTVAEMQRQGVKGSPINFYLANMKDRLTPEGKLVFGMLSELNKKPKQTREFLQIINDVIRGHGDPQQGDLFAGKNPKPNKSQIIKEALQAFDSRYGTDFSKQDLSKWNKSERTLFGSRTKNKATNPVTDKELNNFLRGQAKQISKETGLNFKVVDSVDELRKMFPNNDITDTVEGGIHNDTVYLVKGNIDKDRLPLVIAHEVAGHRGVESLFDSKAKMDAFFNSLERAAAKDKFIRDAFAEVDRLGYKENRSREAMAKIVEKVRDESGTLKGTAKTFVNFITSRVRRLLRRMGFKNLQLSEAEVYDIAVQALRRTGLKNSNKFFGLDRFLAKDNSFLSATSTELDQKYPGWSNRQTTSTGRHSTQAAITEKTYKKIGDWIINSNLKNSKILDASSGMGLGTEALRKMGLNVDDIEPYPGDRKIKPTYSGEDYLDYAEVYKKHGKTYDLIISNAVLNVIPDDWRKAQLHAMADVLLNKGGKLIINVRGDKEVANTKNKIILDSPNEILLPNSNGGYRAYQKGFSQKEFQDWVSKELGAGYKVEKLTPKNSGLSSSTTGVIVTKEGGNGGKRTTESSEREQLDKLAEKAGYNIKAYHGTDKEFDVFKPNNAQGWGKGIYFASEKSDAENYGKNVKEFYISLKNPFDPSDKKANEILDSKAPNTETYKKMAKRTGISDYVDLMNELSENNAEAYRKIIEESGFDGIKAYKSNDINGWEYVIFNPEQAKLADLKTFKDGKEVPLKNRFNKSKADIQFSIGGERAKTANIAKLEEAKKRLKNGEDKEKVWKETGWYIAKDGKPRFWISDKDFSVNSDFVKKTGYAEYPLHKIINHKDLFEAYPELEGMPVTISQSEGRTKLGFEEGITTRKKGGFNPKNKKMEINLNDIKDIDSMEVKETLLHEIQHAVQKIEGTATGASLIDEINKVSSKNEKEWQSFSSKANSIIDTIENPKGKEIAQKVKGLIIGANNDDIDWFEAMNRMGELKGEYAEVVSDKKIKQGSREFFDVIKPLNDLQSLGLKLSRKNEKAILKEGQQNYRQHYGEGEARMVANRLKYYDEYGKESADSIMGFPEQEGKHGFDYDPEKSIIEFDPYSYSESRKVKPDVVSEAEKKILDEIGEVKNPRDYNAVKKIAKNRMAEYKDVFSTKKNTGYTTAALKLHYLLGFDRKTQSVEKAFQSIRDFNTLQKTASAYARSIIGDKSTQASILDSIVKAKTFEKVYDIVSKTNIAKEREIRKDLLDDFRNTIKELNPKKISTPTRMYTDEILGESFTPEELDSLIHSNEFTTKAVGKLRNIADNLASELGNIRKSDIEVSEYAINNAARLKHELNEIIKQRDAGNGAMNVPVEKLAEVNQLLKRFVNQDKLYKESLDTSAKNAAVADREQILSESPEKNPKTVNSRETNSIGRFKEYILPGKALKTQDNENVAATMGKTMHKVAYENLLEGQNRQDHYRATGYKGVDRIMESFGKDLEDGREYLDKTAFKVKTSEGHEYEITNNEALAIIANYLDRETGQMIKKAGKVNFYLGEKKDSDYFTFTRKELDDMVNKLTPKQKKAIEDGFALLSNDFLPELNRVYEKLNGVPLRLIQGRYFPRMHVDVTQSDSKGLITRDRAPYIHQQMNADYQGILKQRDAMATPNLNLRGFTDTLQNYTDQASLYIGMAEPLRHLNRIMNGQMKRELTARYGAEYVNRINQMTRLMAGMAGKTEVDKGFATRYLSNLAAAKLTPLSAIKQLTSVPLASSVIPAEYLAKAAISGMSNENIKEMMELDGMVLRYRSNGIAGIIPVNAKTWGRERIQGEKFKGQKLIDKAVGVGLNLSLMADKRALGIIYKATKLWAESQGKGSDKAWIENKFMEAVRRTQNTTDLASATGWQMDSRESGTMAFLNMYLNQTQKVSNEFFRNKRLMDEAAKKYGKDSAQYKEARNRTATFAASAALMEAMMLAIGSGASMLFKGKDEDSVKDKAVTAVSDLTGNPLLKPMINAYSLQGVLKGKKPTNAAVFGDDFSGMIPEIAYTMGRVMNDLQSDDPAAKKFRKLSYDMLSSKAAETSLALGRVPTWFARYPAKFIKRIWGEDLKNTRQKPSISSSSGSSRLFSGKRTFGNSRMFGRKRMF